MLARAVLVPLVAALVTACATPGVPARVTDPVAGAPGEASSTAARAAPGGDAAASSASAPRANAVDEATSSLESTSPAEAVSPGPGPDFTAELDGRLRDAVRRGDWSRVLELTPSEPSGPPAQRRASVLARALAFESLVRWNEAESEYARALELGDDAPVRIARARALWSAGRTEEAVADCVRAAELAPDDPRPPALELELRLARGEYKKALPAAERALRLRPGAPPLLAQQAEAFYGLGRVAEARAAALQVGPGGTGDALQDAFLARLLGLVGEPAAAHALLDAAVRAGRATPAQWQSRCLLHVLAGDYPAAREACERAASLDSEGLKSLLATIALGEDRPADAQRLLDRMSVRSRANPAVLAFGGQIALQLGDVRGAEARYAEVRAALPQDYDVRLLGVALHIANGRMKDARRELEALRQPHPTLPVVRRWLERGFVHVP